MEKMYEVLRFVEKGTECQPSIDCLQGELLIYYLRDNTQLDKAVLFEWFRQIAGNKKVSAVETRAELSLSDPI